LKDPATITIVSDIHYASDPERARGNDYELKDIANPIARLLLRLHRRHVWLKHPLEQNYLLDAFLMQPRTDFLVANGDFTCDTGFVGLADDAAFASARECIARLRTAYNNRFALTWGDHDLGKKSFYGTHGGMRLESARRLDRELGAPPFWTMQFGWFVLVGFSSSLVGLEALETELPAQELEGWRELRRSHMDDIRRMLRKLQPDQKLILFCHDPTALPFLYAEDAMREKLDQVEMTVLGHLHSPAILRMSRALSGMPPITFLGHTVAKLSRALRLARTWKPFKVVLCPSLAGMELFKDGGYCSLTLRPDPPRAELKTHRLARRR